jgi:hypothetical protein
MDILIQVSVLVSDILTSVSASDTIGDGHITILIIHLIMTRIMGIILIIHIILLIAVGIIPGMVTTTIIQVTEGGKDQARCLPELLIMHQPVAVVIQEGKLQRQPGHQVQEVVQEVIQVIV